MQEFSNQFVRDLAWVVRTNSAIKNALTPEDKFFEDEYENIYPLLLQLDKDPIELVDFLKKSKRITLGNYFEDLIHFWLLNRKDTEILARNLQIRDEKLTIGECDFIVKMEGAITHLEVATKFYLAIENSSAQTAWVGRGLADRLDIKLDKLFFHQLHLSETTAMQAELEKRKIGAIEKKMAIFKGYFFEYYFLDNHYKPVPANQINQQAFWCRISELDKLKEYSSEWQVLQKPHWFTYHDEWLGLTEIKRSAESYFTNVKSTPLLCNRREGRTTTKFFIAPDSWPEE